MYKYKSDTTEFSFKLVTKVQKPDHYSYIILIDQKLFSITAREFSKAVKL